MLPNTRSRLLFDPSSVRSVSRSRRRASIAIGAAMAVVAVLTAAVGVFATARRAAAVTSALRTTYVANGQNSITEYAAGANGNSAPVATIVGAHTGLSTPFGLAVDLSGRLYVSNFNAATVTEYDPGASGDAVPVAVLGGPATGITQGTGLALDRSGRLYVADAGSNSILEFAPGASGNVAPVVKIAGPHTGLVGLGGVAVDSNSRLYVATTGSATSAITEYAPGANGDVAPVAMIAGSNTHLAQPAGITIDATNRLWVTNFQGLLGVTAYAPGANGNVAPVTSIGGSATRLALAVGVAVDPAGRVHTVDQQNHVLTYAAGAKNNVAPSGELIGAATGLNIPNSIAIVPPLFMATSSLPVATVGVAYTAALHGALGTPPYQFLLAGTLPPGLTLNATTGVISGTPTAGGDYTFTTKLADSTTPTANTTSRALTIAVGPQQLYVANDTGALSEYALAARGNALPVNTLNTTSPGALGQQIAVDNAGNLYVVDSTTNTLTAYGPGASANTAPQLTLDPIASGLNGPGGITTDAHGTVYVSNVAGHSISEFAFGALASGVLTHTIIGAHTGLVAPFGVAVDGAGRLHVGSSAGTITTYAAGATGDAAPVATLAGSNTGLDYAASIAFDAAGRLYVLSSSQVGSTIRVFAANAKGNVAPIAVIAGSSTQLVNPRQLAVDASGRIYVTKSSTSSVIEFAPGANGNVAPVTTITGSSTGLSGPTGIAVTPPVFITSRYASNATVGQNYTFPLLGALGAFPYKWTIATGALPAGITLSSGGVLGGVPTATGTASFTVRLSDNATPAHTATRVFTLTTTVRPLVYVANLGNDTVTAYPPGANGDVAPVLTLGGAATGLSGPDGLAVDAAGTLYVADASSAPAGAVTVYAPGASGNATPIRTIAGSNTGIVGPKSLALDHAGRLYVASPLAGKVTVYAPGANGNVAPVGTVTGLSDPNAIALDATGRLWVSNGDTVNLYAAGLTGSVSTPVLTLGGTNTGLSGIEGLAFDGAGQLHASNVNAQTLTTYAAGVAGNSAPTASVTGVVNPFGLVVDTANDLYVARDVPGAYSVDEFGPSGAHVAALIGPSTGLSRPQGIAVTPPRPLP